MGRLRRTEKEQGMSEIVRIIISAACMWAGCGFMSYYLMRRLWLQDFGTWDRGDFWAMMRIDWAGPVALFSTLIAMLCIRLEHGNAKARKLH